MPDVTLTVAGRRYAIACRDGEQPHFEMLAAMLDAKATEAGRALGGMNEARQLLLAGLLLADALNDARGAGPAPETAPDQTDAIAAAIDALAGRIEHLATSLEKGAHPS